jgi:paraquat-inducible protein B
MTMGDTQGPGTPEIPEIPEADAQPRKRWHVQVVWLIPLIALLIGGWLAVRAVMEKGPTITVTFTSAEGLEAGKTKLKYKDVDVGQVTAVTVSRNLDRVVVTAELAKELKPYLVDDLRLWVVRPRIAGGSVSGLGTLLAGSYIALDRGISKKPRTDFVGLDEPLAIQRDRPGREYTLHSVDGGSFGVGSPVLYRQLKVGEVIGNKLAADGKAILTRIFIDQPYIQYVDPNTRFWNASGVDVKVDASGIRVDSKSLASILIGGIAFDTPGEAKAGTAVASRAEFTLFPNHEAAMKNPESETVQFVLVFRETSRGLLPGRPSNCAAWSSARLSTSCSMPTWIATPSSTGCWSISILGVCTFIRAHRSWRSANQVHRRAGRAWPACAIAILEPDHRPAVRVGRLLSRRPPRRWIGPPSRRSFPPCRAACRKFKPR